MARVTGRDSDDRILRWLRARSKGVPVALIAKRDGVPASNVSAVKNAVRKADENLVKRDLKGDYW